MKKLLRVLGLALLLTLGACGGGGGDGGGDGGSNSSGPSKPINSYWTAINNNHGGFLVDMDLRNIIPGQPFSISIGACSAVVEVNGNEFAGFYRESDWSAGCGDLQGVTFVNGAYAVNNNNILTVAITGSNFGLLPSGSELISTYR